MTGQVLDFVRSAHRTTFEVLPWFVNGSLDPSERALVEQHLQDCAVCRRERDWLQRVHDAYAESEPAVDSARSLARIAPQLKAQQAREAEAGPLSRWLARTFGVTAPWLRFALAMQLGVIVALGWALAVRAPPAYRALASPQIPARAAGSIILVFEPATPESEVRRILRDAGARVVDGPTAANAYVLDVAGAPTAALARLRAESAVVLAEPLQAEAPR